jgi:hypothetical protein
MHRAAIVSSAASLPRESNRPEATIRPGGSRSPTRRSHSWSTFSRSSESSRAKSSSDCAHAHDSYAATAITGLVRLRSGHHREPARGRAGPASGGPGALAGGAHGLRSAGTGPVRSLRAPPDDAANATGVNGALAAGRRGTPGLTTGIQARRQTGRGVVHGAEQTQTQRNSPLSSTAHKRGQRRPLRAGSWKRTSTRALP